MKQGNESSITDFILLGLFSDSRHPGLLITIILFILGVAITGNSVLALLIWGDAHHTPMYFLLSQLSLMDLTLILHHCPEDGQCLFLWTEFHLSHWLGAQLFLYLMLEWLSVFSLTLMAFLTAIWPSVTPSDTQSSWPPESVCKWPLAHGLGYAFISLMHTVYAMNFSTCDSREVHHFFCEVMALLKLSVRILPNLWEGGVGIWHCFPPIPFGLILTSYILISFSLSSIWTPLREETKLWPPALPTSVWWEPLLWSSYGHLYWPQAPLPQMWTSVSLCLMLLSPPCSTPLSIAWGTKRYWGFLRNILCRKLDVFRWKMMPL